MFISDIHLGTKHTRDIKTCHALHHTSADKTFFLGDIIDREGKKDWFFPPWHRQILAHGLRRAARPGAVEYLPGNHDIGIRNQPSPSGSIASYRNLCGKSIFNVLVKEFSQCILPNGLKLFLTHGDPYDPTLKHLSKLGDAMLELMANVNTVVQKLPMCGNVSLTAMGKKALKKKVDKKWKIRRNIARLIDSMTGYDGIMSGHSHMSEIGRTPLGKMLLNDGSCTDHCEFLVSDQNGTIGLIEWHRSYLKITEEVTVNGERTIVQSVRTLESLGLTSAAAPLEMLEDEFTAKADRLIRLCFRMWPPKARRKAAKLVHMKKASKKAFNAIVGIPLPNHNHIKRSADRPDDRTEDLALTSLAA